MFFFAFLLFVASLFLHPNNQIGGRRHHHQWARTRQEQGATRIGQASHHHPRALLPGLLLHPLLSMATAGLRRLQTQAAVLEDGDDGDSICTGVTDASSQPAPCSTVSALRAVDEWMAPLLVKGGGRAWLVSSHSGVGLNALSSSPQG